jgi:hypothetical protein
MISMMLVSECNNAQKKKKKHGIQMTALRNGRTSGTQRTNTASNCATF